MKIKRFDRIIVISIIYYILLLNVLYITPTLSRESTLSNKNTTTTSGIGSSSSSVNNDNSSNKNNSMSSSGSIDIDDDDINSFTDEQIESLDSIVYFSSTVGSIGALFIIISFFLFRAARSFATKLIFFLSLSDLMAAIAYLPFGRKSKAMCDLQGMGLVFFLTSSYLWTMCISISLFMVFFTNRYELNHWFKYYHIICWGVPLFSTFISLAFDAYGLTGSWCFIANPLSFFRLFYYIPLIFVFFVNLCVFVAIRIKIQRHNNSMISRVNIIVSFYLIAFSLSQLPTLINSIQNFSNPNHPIYSLFAFQLFLQPLQGFLNCIVYGWNEGFINHYIEFFEKYICRCRKSKELREIEADKTSLLVDYDNSDEEDNANGIDKLIIDDYSTGL